MARENRGNSMLNELKMFTNVKWGEKTKLYLQNYPKFINYQKK